MDKILLNSETMWRKIAADADLIGTDNKGILIQADTKYNIKNCTWGIWLR